MKKSLLILSLVLTSACNNNFTKANGNAATYPNAQQNYNSLGQAATAAGQNVLGSTVNSVVNTAVGAATGQINNSVSQLSNAAMSGVSSTQAGLLNSLTQFVVNSAGQGFSTESIIQQAINVFVPQGLSQQQVVDTASAAMQLPVNGQQIQQATTLLGAGSSLYNSFTK